MTFCSKREIASRRLLTHNKWRKEVQQVRKVFRVFRTPTGPQLGLAGEEDRAPESLSLRERRASHQPQHKSAEQNQRNAHNRMIRNILHRIREIQVWWPESLLLRERRASHQPHTKPACFHLKQKYAKRNQRNTYNGITRNMLHKIKEILVWWSESRPVRGERARVPHAASNKTGPLASTCRNILNRIREIQCGQSSLAQSQRWGSDLQPHQNTVSV